MSKLKNPLFGLNVRGSLGKALSFRGRGKETIAEKKPIPTDAKSLAQLSWRHMYQKAVALWHALSAEEKQDWESKARRRHMTGFAWFVSQCLKPNPGIYLPLQGGKMQGDIDMATHRILDLPLPSAVKEPVRKKDLSGHAALPSVHHSNLAGLTFIIDGSDSAITIGQKGHLEIPFACTIKRVTMFADQPGSIVVDIWKDTYAAFPPTDGDSITSTTPPTISGARKSQDSTLTNWATAIAAGDSLAFNVDSCATITRVTISLKVEKG